MWKALQRALSRGARTQTVPDTIHIYRVNLPHGLTDIASVLPEDAALASGLQPKAIVGSFRKLIEKGEGLDPASFRANVPFVDLLHSIVATHGPALPELQAEARRQGTGWVYVIDARTPTPGGAVPPSDIIGGFEVRAGTVAPDSYRPNPNHQIFSPSGFFKLDPRLHERLLAQVLKPSGVGPDDSSA